MRLPFRSACALVRLLVRVLELKGLERGQDVVGEGRQRIKCPVRDERQAGGWCRSRSASTSLKRCSHAPLSRWRSKTARGVRVASVSHATKA